MSNDYVIASAQFLKESWYRENAGTPEIQEAKLLDEIFEEIVDYCLECDIELDDSVEIANRVIEEDLITEFYEEFLIEKPINPTARTNWNQVRSRVGVPPKTNVGALDPNRLLHRSSPTGARLPAARTSSGIGGNLTRVGVVGGLTAALVGGPLARPTVSGSAEQRAIQKANASRTSQQRARVAAEKANKQAREQLANRNNTQVNRDSVRRSYSPSIRTTSNTVSKSTLMPSAKPSDRGLTTVGGQGVATNTGSLAREPQAPFNPTRPIISSIFKDKNNPLKTESTENFFSEQGMMDLSSVRRERERFTQSRNQGSTRTRTPQRTSPASTQTTPSSVNLPRSGNASIINRIYSNSPDIRTRWNWLNAKPSPATSVRQASTTSTTPRQSPIATTSTVSPRTGSTPTVPRTTPTAPTARASTLSSRSNATASVRPIVPTAPARATEPTAPPVTRPTMARLGQGERDSIFNREGGRQEYERRMIQAIRSGRRYQPAASTGTPTMNAPRTLGGGVSA